MATFERMKQRETYESLQAMNQLQTTTRRVRRYGGGRGRRSVGFFNSSSDRTLNNKGRSLSNYHDNYWESSYDWKDRDDDGYDERNDGFWQEAE